MGDGRLPGPIRRLVERYRSLKLKLRSLDNLPPSFAEFRIDTKRFVLGTAGELTLRKSEASGTPPGSLLAPQNTAKLTLNQPLLSFDGQLNRLRGTAVLSVPDQYPATHTAPTEIPVSLMLDFDTPRQVRGRGNASVGPLRMDFKLRLGYDEGKVAAALIPGLRRGDVSAALKQAAAELGKPGDGSDLLPDAELDFSGVVKLAIPLIERELPLTSIRAWARPPRLTLSDGTFGVSRYSLGYRAFGVIPTPPGSLFSVPAVGLGYTYSSYDGRTRSSFTGAAVPTLDLAAISGGQSTVAQFPVVGYLEYSRLTRVNKEVELGFSVNVAGSTVDLARSLGNYEAPQVDMLEYLRDVGSGRESSLPKPNVLLNFIGRFK